MKTAAGENSRRDFLENRFTFLFLSKRSLYKSNGSVPKKIFRKSGVEITKSSNLGIFKTAIKLREKRRDRDCNYKRVVDKNGGRRCLRR